MLSLAVFSKLEIVTINPLNKKLLTLINILVEKIKNNLTHDLEFYTLKQDYIFIRRSKDILPQCVAEDRDKFAEIIDLLEKTQFEKYLNCSKRYSKIISDITEKCYYDFSPGTGCTNYVSSCLPIIFNENIKQQSNLEKNPTQFNKPLFEKWKIDLLHNVFQF